ncbi:MAG: hypothetical protein JXA89_27530 [Anaerolineae bacterium]|nr:hypothetical protein [Anaerolineae bacterium]
MKHKSENKRFEYWPDLIVLAVYVAVSLAMCAPLPAQFSTQLAGAHSDARVFQWNNWWIKRAILSGQNPMHTDMIYYPAGASLSSHNTNWVSSLIAIPLDLLFGPVVAYNTTFLLTLFLPAVAMYLLTKHLTQRRDAAFLAGLVFAFFPYHVSGNWDGQMNLANIQWLPLFILFVLRLAEQKNVWDAVWAGVFFALASLDCWFFAIFLALWSIAYVLYSLLLERTRWNWRFVWLGGLAILIAIALLSPLMVPVLVDAIRGTGESALDYYATEKSTDLLAFVIPSSQHPILGRYVEPITAGFKHWRPAFLGYMALILALFSILAWRKSVLWWALLLLFASLALGTTLAINGVDYAGVPLPYDLLTKTIPALKIIRQASRFNVMVGLTLAVLVGLGWTDVSRWLDKKPWLRRSACGIAGILFLFEYLAVPCPSQPGDLSPFYTRLAQEPGDFAILELPLDDFYSRRSLYAQTIHGKKLVNGYLARIPAGVHDFVLGNGLLKKLFIQMEADPALQDVDREIELLALNDIRYVVIQKQPLPPHPAVDAGVQAAWRELFGPDAFYEDTDIVVYETRANRAPKTAPMASSGSGLKLLTVEPRRVQILDKSSLIIDLTWQSLDSLNQDYRCQLSLQDSTGKTISRENDAITPRYPTSHWPVGTVMAEQYALSIEDTLPAGDYVLSIAIGHALRQNIDDYEIPIHLDNTSSLLAPALNDMRCPADVVFGEQMWLLGYTPRQEGNQITLDLYWQALRAMPTNYKFFVHLVRPSDGTIVAQHDWMPRNWSYPTSLWDRQELFVDRIAVNVDGVEPGSYQLAIGVYEPEGDRLATVAGTGIAAAGGRAILQEPIEVKAP